MSAESSNHRSLWLAITLSCLTLIIIICWAFGPHELAPWREEIFEGINVQEIARRLPRKLSTEQKLALRRELDKAHFGYKDKLTLPVMVQSFFHAGYSRNDNEPAGLAEKSFTRFVALDALLAALLALALLIWRRGNTPAHRLATTLGLFGFALACFLINGQARLRSEWFAWPSWSRLLTDVAATVAFGLSLIGLDRFFSIFPVRLEDWQVIQSQLRWRGRLVAGGEKIRTAYRVGKANWLSLARLIPKITLWLLLAGTISSTLPYLLYTIRFPLDVVPDGTPQSFERYIGHGSLVVGAICGSLAMLLLMAFGWLLAVSLLAKLRAGREQCTEEERQRTDWLFSGGLTVVLMLVIFSFGLILGMVYLAWGDNEWISKYGGSTAMLFFPAGWTIMLLALAGAVFLSKSFGPKPLLKRTVLVATAGMLMSLLLAAIQHLVTTKILSHSTAAMQNGLSTVLAGGIAVFSLGFFRVRMERGIDDFLNRFMPATVIADGKRRDLTVVFSDLGGYTALSAADEAQALHVAGHFQKTATEMARRHNGRIVKTIGDAVMWVFATPGEAFAAALELPEGFKQSILTDKLADLPVNSGVHFGSVVEAPGGDVYGATVNLAARLQGVAKDGTVVVSSEAMLEVSGGFRFEPMGKLELKNVPVPVACFKVALV